MVQCETSRLCLLLVGSLLCQLPAASGLFEWLRSAEAPPPPAVEPPQPADVLPAPLAKDAPFEMATVDDQFLAEAKHLEISPLESCHYRVVARLKASCDSLTEEQLGKLGVVLFNCQADSEGRPTYQCTDQMTLKECTQNMDTDTWNAYHIISNRARSVCYATRQQLFRRRAELTVNSLISTATSQLETMKDLKDGQLELKDLTAASLDKLLGGHEALRAQQGKLYQGQEQMESSLKDNLVRLSQEKALIASGQELVAQLIQGITQKIENVSEHLQVQGLEVHDSRNEIAKDLADVRHQAQDIYQKLDDSMLEFLQYQHQTTQYYSDLMSKLERMNSTLGSMQRYLDSMQRRVEERLHMIQGYLGWAGLSLTAMWTCVAHMAYFVVCAVLLSFLRCPASSRAVLLLSVSLNAVAEVNQQPSLGLASLSVLLLTLCTGHWLVKVVWLSFTQRKPAPLLLAPVEIIPPQKDPGPVQPSYPPSSTPQKEKKDAFMDENDILRGFFDPANELRDFVNDSRSASPTPSLVSNNSISSRQLCSGITKTGKVCKKKALLGHDYCRVHEGGHTSYTHS